ncbi:MAG: iron-containing redox enzyme family protein [Polyangiaceae bacterium]
MNHLSPFEATSEQHVQGPSAWAESIVDEYELISVADHALFVELGAAPVDLGKIWLLMANLATGISRDFVIWLAQTIARVDDPRIASLLAKQLNDELGDGSFTQIHSRLLERFVRGLEPWRPRDSDEALVLEPGRRLARRGCHLFTTSRTYEAVGALMVGEVFAKKMDHCVGDEIRRQNALGEEVLTWLTLHETLEVDHADDSRLLASLVPHTHTALAECRVGAASFWQYLWDFLDGVHGVANRHPS